MSAPSRLLVFCLATSVVVASCATAALEKKLDPESRDFFEKVQLIITPEESRTFLSLPPEKRKEAIADFWARRNPTPGTPENEYKDEYFRRIKEANRLFSGGGSPGWLQDRGRVYILLGPPDTRETYPRGVTFYGVPTEIWWYGFFSIVFVDERWIGDYTLEPQSAMQLSEISRAQVEWNQARDSNIHLTPGGVPPEFEMRILKSKSGGATVRIVLPYRDIWLKAQGSQLQATLELALKVVDASGARVWSHEEKYHIDIPESQRKEILPKDYEISVPMPLGPGAYTLNLSLTNANNGGRADVQQKFEIRKEEKNEPQNIPARHDLSDTSARVCQPFGSSLPGRDAGKPLL